MNWYNIYLGFIFLCNLCFLVGAGFLLYRIVDSVDDMRLQLLKAARENTQASRQLLAATQNSIRGMERASESQIAREASNDRAITELSDQVKALVSSLKRLSTFKAPAISGPAASGWEASGAGGEAPTDGSSPANSPDAQKDKLRAELNDALARNRQLQDEISKTVYQLRDVSQANQSLVQEIRDMEEVKGMKKAYVDQLLERAAQLESQLQQARDRAKVAERLAESNAFKLENLREEAENYTMSGKSDQSGLIKSQQDQIDLLAAQETALLVRIDTMEQMFKRNQVEKEFIEERFLKLDADEVANASARGALEPQPSGAGT